MAMRRLNDRQEEELVRLVGFERNKCMFDGVQPYHCAFPLKRDDRNQHDLVKLGMLAIKMHQGTNRPFVCITPLGYAFVEEREAALEEVKRLQQRDVRLVILSGLFACVCTLAGVVMGRMLS